MDRGRKPNLVGSEVALQLRIRQERMGVEELREDKLTHLQTFVSSLEKTPAGGKELQHRFELFGECKRVEGESAVKFYGRLRFWLDRSLP